MNRSHHDRHSTPRHVAASTADAAAVLRRLARDGWHTREGFTVGHPDRDLAAARLVLYGRVPDPDTAQACIDAAARGAGIVAVTDPASDTGRALLDHLRRLGPVATGGAEPSPDPMAALAPEQRALLDRLAAGDTIAAAAAADVLSLRTANRRIAEARTVLGVQTTREAVLLYLQHRDQP